MRTLCLLVCVVALLFAGPILSQTGNTSTQATLPAAVKNDSANNIAGVRAEYAGPSSSKPKGKPVTQPGILKGPGEYYLPADLSCSGTCIALEGGGIAFNLNGHTLTYGTGGGKIGAVYGIVNDACWDMAHGAKAEFCGNGAHNVEIFGGSIVQAKTAPDFSHAVFLGQNNGNGNIHLHDLKIAIQQRGTQAIVGQYLPGGTVIEHNTITDNVTAIEHLEWSSPQGVLSARSQFQGQAISLEGATKSDIPNSIHNNKIIGSPQGGIRDTASGTLIFENDISQNATYANDFCIDVPGNGQSVQDNFCHPENGRGLHVNGENAKVIDNTIVVTEAAVNGEYHGCELIGAFGIQLEDDSVSAVGGDTVTGNNVTVNTGECGGGAIRVTGWPTAATASIHGNTLTINKTKGKDVYGGLLYSLSASDLTHVVFGGDSLKTGDQWCAGVDWDGAQNATLNLTGCTAPHAWKFGAGNETSIPVTTATSVGSSSSKVECGPYATVKANVNHIEKTCTPKQ